jgi:HPt (histidine-containing phosphotransfer) domain-containing protein
MERKPLDLSVLQDVFGSDAASITTFLTDLLPAVGTVEAKIKDALALQDWSGARRAVHEMKGMCASSGCSEVADLCVHAEAALDSGEHGSMAEFSESLRLACGRLRTALGAASAAAA